MSNIYGITLGQEGKIYYFNGKDLEIENETKVVVETEKGIQLGKVMYKAEPEKVKIDVDTMKTVVRIASDDDYDTYMKNLGDSAKCLVKAREIVKELEMDMNILDANYTLDRKQLLFNFIADE